MARKTVIILDLNFITKLLFIRFGRRNKAYLFQNVRGENGEHAVIEIVNVFIVAALFNDLGCAVHFGDNVLDVARVRAVKFYAAYRADEARERGIERLVSRAKLCGRALVVKQILEIVYGAAEEHRDSGRHREPEAAEKLLGVFFQGFVDPDIDIGGGVPAIPFDTLVAASPSLVELSITVKPLYSPVLS